MTRTVIRSLAVLLVLFGGHITFADDPLQVKTHRLTVEEKLALMETIEITSEKELKESSEPADEVVESILEEISQLESESDEEDSST